MFLAKVIQKMATATIICELKEMICLDRSNGGGSIHDGSLEIMIHRRIPTDQSPLGEPLNETEYGQGLVVRGRHLLIIDTPDNSTFFHRTNAQQLFMQPIPTFSLTNLTYANYSASYRQTWSALADPMPHNLHLLTLDQLASKQYLIRVEHYFEAHEDAIYSQPIEVDLQQVFHSIGTITNVTELILTANMALSNLNRLNWTTTENQSSYWRHSSEDVLEDTVVILKAMQIRTFQVAIK